MTTKEKAKELYLKFYIPDYCYAKAGMSSDWRQTASKNMAIKAVDEIINVLSKDINPLVNYWFEVKQEIEKL